MSGVNDLGGPAIEIRSAGEGDANAIADIYNHYILNETCTFHTAPVEIAERAAWINEGSAAYPRLVAVSGGEVVGWGSLAPWASRPAWYPSVELAVYVSPEHRGSGVGRSIMEALIAAAHGAGHHAILGQIVSENQASIALAEKMGFEKVGELREVGEKFGRRLDVVIMELIAR